MIALMLVLAAPAAYAAPSVELVGLDGNILAVGVAELEQLQPSDITVPDPLTCPAI